MESEEASLNYIDEVMGKASFMILRWAQESVEFNVDLAFDVACGWAFDVGQGVLSTAGCCYCDEKFPNYNTQILKNHVELLCPNHPLRAKEARIKELEKQLLESGNY